MIESTPPPVLIDMPDGDEDKPVFQRLESASLISGTWGRGEGADCFMDAALTGSGRVLLRELEQEEIESTSIGFLKKSRFAIYKWIGAVLGGVIIGWVTRSFFK